MVLEKILEYRIRQGDLDCYDHLSLYAILDVCQDIAGLHAEDFGAGYEQLLTKGITWLIIGNKVEVYENNIRHGEIIKVKTWPHKTSQLHCDRDYLIYDESDNLVAKATSKWVLFDIKRKRLIPARNIFENCEYSDEKNYPETIMKLDYEDNGDFKLVNTHTVSNFDLDHNKHFNNAKYVAMLYDACHIQEDKRITGLHLDYINQCFPGDEVQVYCKDDGSKIYFYGKVKDVVVFDALLEIK